MRKGRLKKFAKTLSYAYKNHRIGRAVYPFYASLKVSNVCASKCHFCDLWKEMLENPQIMPKEDCFKIIDNCAKSSVLVLSFEGGEPFFHKDIIEMLKYASSKSLLTELTCSAKPSHFNRYPLKEAAPYLDFLHFSIDEGHENLELFDRLETLRQYHKRISIQIVVTSQTLSELEWKINKIHQCGMWTIIMPAAPLDKADQVLPNLREFATEVARLKKKYPRTILTSDFMLENLLKSPGGCSAASIIIDGDNKLYYPCRVLEKKTVDLTQNSLNDFILSKEADAERDFMEKCERPCGWCQYYATVSGTSVLQTFKGIKPLIQYFLFKQVQRVKKGEKKLENPIHQPL